MEVSEEAEKQKLLSRLLDAVKQCQIRFGGKTELATERDGRVSILCRAWESVLQHGMKHNNKAIAALKQFTTVTGFSRIVDDINHMETEPAFWCYVKTHLSVNEVKRCMLLKNVQTDAGRGMAWLRSSLNEHSLEKYTNILIGSKDSLSQFYEDWAFLRDEEKCAVLPTMAAGLASILFAINIDNAEFNVIKPATSLVSFLSKAPVNTQPVDDKDPLPAVMAKNITDDTKKDRKRKQKPAKIVTFDDDDLSSLSASPASSVVSPAAGVTTAQQNSSNRLVSRTAHDGPTTLANHGTYTETAIASTTRQDLRTNNPSSTTQTSNVYGNNSNTPDKFSFDISEQSSSNGKDSTTSIYATHGNATSNFNGLSKNSLRFSSPLVALNDVRSVESSSTKSVGTTDTHNSGASSGCVDLDSFKTTSFRDGLATTNIDCRTGRSGCSDLHKAQSSDNLIRTNSDAHSNNGLFHSNSEASKLSMSTSFPSDYLISSDLETDLSLVPLNSDGRPVEFDGLHDNLDGDTTSGSYGSYDSREMPLYSTAQTTSDVQTTLARPLSNHRSGQDVGSSVDGKDSSETLSNADLREALIAMMIRKEEVQEENKNLQAALKAESELSATLRSELKDFHATSAQRIEKDAEHSRNLTRENELLKHQLKKYVSAVQMLRRQGASPDDFPGIHMDPVQPAIPSPGASVDYSYEAEEYEKKLIQVAEMHGELMEFNEGLQRQLSVQETQIKHLTDELVSLRGPLPVGSDNMYRNDTSNSGWDSNSLNSIPSNPLINIWIPSAFLRGSAARAFHVYQVYVRIRDEEWNVYRRYAEFYELHCKLRKNNPIVNTYNFPPKKTFGKKDTRTVEVRRKTLQTYLRQVIILLTQSTPELTDGPSKAKLIRAVPFFGDQPLKQRKRDVTSNDQAQAVRT